jgi:hypothetical protein
MISDDVVGRLREHRAEGVTILGELVQSKTKPTAKTAIAREIAWVAELLEILKPFGDAVLAKCEPLNKLRPGEQAAVLGVVTQSDAHGWSLICHAARMSRLENLFDRLLPETFKTTPVAGKRGRPSGKDSFLERTERWAKEIDRAIEAGISIREVAKQIASKDDVDFATVERETRRVRAERGKEKIRQNFPRR